jgi:tetratricopeptide (TPR) repeat protein
VGVLWVPFVYDDFSLRGELLSFGWTQPRPLFYLTISLEQSLGGGPMLAHGIGLLFHLINVWLALEVLKRVVVERAALAGTLVFALHPMQTEPVAYVFARPVLMMTLFSLLALLAWLRGRHWIAAAWLVPALLAKEEAVALPVVILLLHLSLSRDRKEWRPLAAMFALAGVFGLRGLYLAASVPGSGAASGAGIGPLDYLRAQGAVLWEYFARVLTLRPLSIDPWVADPGLWGWLGWLGVVVALMLGARTRMGIWIAAGVVLLLPTSSVLPLDDLAASRRLYLPLVAFGAATGLALQRLPAQWPILLALVLSIASWQRVRVWQSPSELWAEALAENPARLRPRIQLARSLPPPEALSILDRAPAVQTDLAALHAERGRVLLELGRPADALAAFGRQLALAPNDPAALYNRGVALQALGQRDAAREDFRRSLESNPAFGPARDALATSDSPRTRP